MRASRRTCRPPPVPCPRAPCTRRSARPTGAASEPGRAPTAPSARPLRSIPRAIFQTNSCCSPLFCTTLLDFDELELHAVRSLEEAHPPAPRNDGLLEDSDALSLELRDKRVELVGVDGDVLHAVLLLARLVLEKARDVEVQPVEIQAVAAARVLVHDLRAERVNVELGGLFRILGLQVQVFELQRHGASSRSAEVTGSYNEGERSRLDPPVLTGTPQRGCGRNPYPANPETRGRHRRMPQQFPY